MNAIKGSVTHVTAFLAGAVIYSFVNGDAVFMYVVLSLCGK